MVGKLKKTMYLCKGQISSTIATDKMKTIASIGCNDGEVIVFSLVNYKVICMKKHHSFVVAETAIDNKSNVASIGLDYNYVVSPITTKSNSMILMIACLFVLVSIIYYCVQYIFF